MLISEIITPKLRANNGAKVARKNIKPIKGPYAPPPKPLPKPKPPKLTPLQLKQKRQNNIQAYAKAVERTIGSTSSTQNTKQPQAQTLKTSDNSNLDRDDREKEAFLKQLHGEIS